MSDLVSLDRPAVSRRAAQQPSSIGGRRHYSENSVPTASCELVNRWICLLHLKRLHFAGFEIGCQHALPWRRSSQVMAPGDQQHYLDVAREAGLRRKSGQLSGRANGS